ncbi:MAG: hypothetical protein O2930_11650 [Acidobacteria bacterium]|nr:hypothetical protein [Acidobacteriota bacterium]
MPVVILVSLLLIGLVAVATATTTLILRRRRRDALLARRRAEWGQILDRDRDYPSLVDFHHARKDDGPSIDDRTWEDLHLDAVFTVLERTESPVGQQALYHRLRTPFVGPTLTAFDAMVNLMGENTAERERAQVAMAPLRHATVYDLWRFARPGMLDAPAGLGLFPLLGALTLLTLIVAPVWPIAMLGAALASAISLIARAAMSRRLRAPLEPFRYVGSLLAAARTLDTIALPGGEALIGTLREDRSSLSRLRRIARWAPLPAGDSIDPARAAFRWIGVLLSLDLSALFFGLREMKSHGPTWFRLIAAVGEIDAAISIASYRQGSAGWTRPVWRDARTTATLAGIRHPLLGDAVPNSVTLGNPAGMIVTGSNMSGKSTFLRTVGVTTVLAQTIYTCLADAYEAPPFVVKSCIGRADDPASGKSYYLVEVDSVLTLVRDSDSDVPHLFLFDELFRGTNAVERIAAGEAVLRSLLEKRADGTRVPHVVLAATHDQDLIALVEDWYAAYHFADAIGDDDGLAFDYQLKRGVASARNAIRLLEIRGAPATLVARALERAAALDRPVEPEPEATADVPTPVPNAAQGVEPPAAPRAPDVPNVIV